MVHLRNDIRWRHLFSHLKNIIYADNAVVVVNKPSGLVCQSEYNPKQPASHFDTLLHAVKSRVGLETLPYQLHRLDKFTTGALLFATNQRNARAFAKQFHDHEIKKSYLAIVRGGRKPFEGKTSGTIDTRLSLEDGRVKVDKEGGSLALTGWELLGSSDKVPLSLLRLNLFTGHKHQLRVHLAETLQCPVLGDTLYSKSLPTPEIMALIPSNISISKPRSVKDESYDPPTEAPPRIRTPPEERIFLHSAHITMTRYQQRGPKHKKVTLGISAPVPPDFLAICTAAGIQNAIPESFVKGSMEIDGVPVPLREKVEGLEGRWLGELEPEERPSFDDGRSLTPVTDMLNDLWKEKNRSSPVTESQ